MNIAARAIIIENDNILVMQRIVDGNTYYTLVGGQVQEGETNEQAVIREVYEETGLHVTGTQHVYTEVNPVPYNSQYIYVCSVAPHEAIGIVIGSEEDQRNKLGLDVHAPFWVPERVFSKLAFRTPQLQLAVTKALRKGFPKQPEVL